MAYDAFQYAMNYEIYRETDWPYTGRDEECNYDESIATRVKLETYVCIEPQTPEAMKAALAKQPIAVSIDAGSWVF